MIERPPIAPDSPSRSHGSGRRPRPPARLALAIALAVAGCGTSPPAPSASDLPSPSPSGDPAPGPPDGLLVSTGGGIGIIDASGVLAAFDEPAARVTAVSAGSGSVVALDAAGRVLLSADPGGAARSWTTVELPAVQSPTARSIALSPAGTTLAIVDGELQGRMFELIVLDPGSGARRSHLVERGLDGPPRWLGNGRVAVNAISNHQRSGMAVLDVGTGELVAEGLAGYSIAATADGRTVAFDDAATGETLVGAASEWLAAKLEGMARIPGDGRPAIAGLALNAAGTRLAVLRSGDTDSTIELFHLRDLRWDAVQVVTMPGNQAITMAWLR